MCKLVLKMMEHMKSLFAQRDDSLFFKNHVFYYVIILLCYHVVFHFVS